MVDQRERPVGELTEDDIKEMTPAGQAVVREILKAIRQMPDDMADHLRRRIFVKGDAMKYDPGDEPPIKVFPPST